MSHAPRLFFGSLLVGAGLLAASVAAADPWPSGYTSDEDARPAPAQAQPSRPVYPPRAATPAPQQQPSQGGAGRAGIPDRLPPPRDGGFASTPPQGAEAFAPRPAGAPAAPQASADAPPEDRFEDTDPSALSDFKQPLAAHGKWIEDPKYGTVWVPNREQVGADFAPYQTGGHWALDARDEWMWVSDYSWGHIPFHYGRWFYAGPVGWAWVPGRVYAPAWVSWRVGPGGYIGWGALPPAYYWRGGVAVRAWGRPVAAYAFVPTHAVFSNHVAAHVVRTPAAVHAAAATTTTFHAGASAHAGSGHVAASTRASPTLGQAHVPASAAPSTRASADARAAAYARPSTSGHTAAATHAGRSSSSAHSGRGFADHGYAGRSWSGSHASASTSGHEASSPSSSSKSKQRGASRGTSSHAHR